MKKNQFFETLKIYAIGIVIAPFLLLGLILYLLSAPIEIFRYYNMSYYKATKEKYSPFCTIASKVKIYNQMAKNDLGWEYVDNGDINYFIRNGEALLFDWIDFNILFEENDWWFDIAGHGDLNVKEEVESAKIRVRECDRDKKAKLLIFEKAFEGPEILEKAKNSEIFYIAPSLKELK